MKPLLVWAAVCLVVAVPIGVAASSPLLQWRQPIYIVAGLAGVIAMALLLMQPLLVGGYLPGLAGVQGRRWHRWVGTALLAAVLVHVIGLWIFSPPDVLDALMFRSPTPFSVWGVVAFWAVIGAAILALVRRSRRWTANRWRFAHSTLTLIVVISSAIHAWLIDGTMGTASKAMLCALCVLATVWVIRDLHSWALLKRKT